MMQAQAIIKRAVEALICFGIMPAYLRGVGIPLSQRSTTAARISFNLQSIPSPSEDELLKTLLVIVDLQASHPELASLLVSRYLSDLLAGLAQLAYAPKATAEERTAHAQTRRICIQKITLLIETVLEILTNCT